MLRLPTVATATAMSLLLVACAGSPPPRAPDGTLTIKGALAYRERIALPPDASAVVELRDVSRADGRVVAERRIDLRDRQAPVAFELAVDRARLDGGRRYALRGGIAGGGRPLWASEPVMVDARDGVVDLGTLTLTAVRAGAFATAFVCGAERATIDYAGQSMRLTVGHDRFELKRAPAASGERYEAVGDPTTWFWSKGDRATVAVRGRTYAECAKAPDHLARFRATGNEPGWRLDIDGDTMTLVEQRDGTRVVFATPAAQRADAFTRYAARNAGGDMTVTIRERLCRDTMTGMPHPHAVEVLFDGRTLAGCGGDPAALLRGGEWVVEDIAGKGIVDRSRATLAFDAGGRLAGRASCNAYTAQYGLTGEGLTVSKATATMMACPAALMQQERLFLDVLQQANRFDIRTDGALVLYAADGRTIVARRQEPPGRAPGPS